MLNVDPRAYARGYYSSAIFDGSLNAYSSRSWNSENKNRRKQTKEGSAFSPTESGRASLLNRATERVCWKAPYAVNDEPQPQLPVAFGFVNVKPEPITLVT